MLPTVGKRRFEPPTATAGRRRHRDNPPTSDGHHRRDGGEDLVAHSGCLVNNEKVGRVSTNPGLAPGNTDDPAAILQSQAERVLGFGLDGSPELLVEDDDLFEELGGLALRGAHDQHKRARSIERLMRR